MQSADADSARDQCNLNLACLRTAVKLLEHLDVKNLEGSIADDSGHVVSRVYLRYSTVLLSGLDFCQPDVSVRFAHLWGNIG
jgi:neurofibromin 1